MNKSFKFLIFILVFIFLTTLNPIYKKDNKSLIFPIRTIKLENNFAVDTEDLILELSYLKGKNLLFINEENLKSTIITFDFISSFEFKKILPDTLKIKIYEKKPIAISIKGKNKFYISRNGDLIKFVNLDIYKNLPILIGNKNNFSEFVKKLDDLNFSLEKIKSFHSFDIGRWDLILRNDKIIKLPKLEYVEALDNFILIENNKKFEDYIIFDYRIKNQLILK
jgi:cell division protein FtsQ|tara:strand:+ start:330 stop:998 length:669 start_codon:yes stop_codon:yes gene_type:complete